MLSQKTTNSNAGIKHREVNYDIWVQRQVEDEFAFWENPKGYESLEGFLDYKTKYLSINKNMFSGLKINFINGTVCDVGCGPFAGLLPLVRAKIKLAIDPLISEYLSIEHDFTDVMVVESCAENLPIPSNTIDACYCVNALDHMYKPYEALAEMIRVIKPGGYFAFAVDVGGTPHHPIAIYEHYLDEILTETNFKIIEKKCSANIRSSWPASAKIPVYVFQGLKKSSTPSVQNRQTDNVLSTKFPIIPLNRTFGFQRGTPIDRYYIEKFLLDNGDLIFGQIMEIAGKNYSLQFGQKVETITALGVEAGAGIDLVGDLATGKNIPQEQFDCIILTQTVQFIFDVKAALKHAYAALKPGGSILLTASGISQISRYDMDRWGEYWRFTDKSMDRLVTELLPLPEFEIKTYGNVGVAKAFLDGLAFEELPAESLSFNDPDYQLLVAARITKPVTVSLRREEKNEKASMVLIYHRVADDPVDRNLLTVSPDNFAEHLKILQNEFRPVPLRQFLDEAEKGKLIPGTVSLTFDDGYLDNLLNALPLLEKYRVPATVFVVSGMIGSQREFWWDAMERVFLADPQRQLPERIVFMGSDGEEKGWRTVSKAERLRAHDEICTMLRGNSVAEINEFVEKIFLWAGERRPPRKSHLVLSELELRELSESPMIEIGAHTVNHSRLTALPISEQKIEIESSRNELEKIIGKPVRLFSYPYGGASDFSFETKSIVEKCGFEYGIANIQSDFVLPFDKFAVPRRLVRNWSSGLFKEWITGVEDERGRLDVLSCRQKGVELAL